MHSGGAWRAYTVYTLLEEVHGWPQAVGRNRPYGRHNDREPHDARRAREADFKDKDPEVLISGSGRADQADLQSVAGTTASPARPFSARSA